MIYPGTDLHRIESLSGFFSGREKVLTINMVTTDEGECIAALKIAHDLVSGKSRFMKAEEELFVRLCISCGMGTSIGWRGFSDRDPWEFVDLADEHHCARPPSDAAIRRESDD